MQHQRSPPQVLNLATEQIQQYLDQNKQLIMAIMENQNNGKFAECASYQGQLQENLMYLARIADAQPQGTAMPSQMPQQSSAQQEQYMQPSQLAMPQQPMFFNPKHPFQLNDHQEQQLQMPPHFQQQHLSQAQMRLKSGPSDGNTEA